MTKYNKNILLDKIDTEIRNAVIVATYEVLDTHTKMKYKDKIKWLSETHFLSDRRIEQILQDSKEF